MSLTNASIVALAYAFTGWLGLQMPYAGSHITLVWLPTGIAVAALVLLGWRVWPGILVGSLLATLSVGSSWPMAMGIAVGNTLGPLLSMAVLHRAGFQALFERQRDVGWFMLAAALGMCVSASGGGLSLYLAGLLDAQALGSSWLAWWMGDTVGVLLVGPLLLTLTRKNLALLVRFKTQLLLWCLATALVVWFAVIGKPAQDGHGLALAFLTPPLIAWAALRFGITGAALAGLVYALVAALGTGLGYGVFVHSDVTTTLTLLWAYMATTTLTGLLIAALQAERLQTENTLRDSELQLRTIIETEPECVKTTTRDGRLLQMNRAGLDMVEADSLQQVLGREMGELIEPPFREQFQLLTQRVFAGESGNIEFKIRGFKGGTRWLLSHSVPLRGAQGAIVSALSVTRDITQRKQAEEQLRIAACAFESQQGMVVTDANRVILRVNRAFTEITGYSAEEAVGQTPRLLQSDRHQPAFYADMWDTIHRTGGWQGEVWDKRKNGEIFPKWLTISTVRDESGAVTHYVGTHSDITQRKLAEEKIEKLAFHDQLTGLPNRTLLLDRLRQTLSASAREDNHGALLFIDLDHFKTLNDTLGHDMGDLLLKQVAHRVSNCMREGDTVARLGGDEFVVMLASLGPRESDAASSTETVAGKILAALNQPYQLNNTVYHSTASIGVTLFKGQQVTIDELMRQADLAMYRAKAEGRNAVRFFDRAMEAVVMERAALEEALRRALVDEQFLLHFQAQLNDAGQVTGAEVLVRWLHPQRGLVAPGDFISLAEETGLILPLGRWVLQTACSQQAGWARQADLAHLAVAVNVSAHQFRQPDFVAQVVAILQSTGADPRRVKLELTESLMVSDIDDVTAKMLALKAHGLGFSLDDFGTGYSSLAYLKRMPLDQLKIDQSFVRDVLTDPNDAVIAKTIIALAHSLGLEVIAEGVETAAQRDFLAQAGCKAFQGYFFSRPLPLAGFEDFARRH